MRPRRTSGPAATARRWAGRAAARAVRRAGVASGGVVLVPLRLAGVAALIAAAVLACGAPPAHGAGYVVVGCAEQPYLLSRDHVVRGTDGWVGEGLVPPGGDTCHEGVPGRGLFAISYGPFAGFRFESPHGTVLTDLWTWNGAHIPAGGALVAEALKDGRWVSIAPGRAATVEALDVSGFSHAAFGRASAVRIGAGCPAGSCWSPASAEVRSVAVGLEDPNAPLLDPFTVGDRPRQGDVSLTVGALDHESGVASLRVTLAGHEVARWTGDGACAPLSNQVANVPHYETPVPCPASAAKAVSIDTAALPDGDHVLTVRAEDAAGNATTASEHMTLDNHPPAPGSVRVSGRATVGERLVAEASGFAGQDPKLTLTWERCAEPGEPCTTIADDQHEYTLAPAEAGSRVRVRATATDGGGATSATSPLSAVVSAPATNAPATTTPAAPAPAPQTIVITTPAPAPAPACAARARAGTGSPGKGGMTNPTASIAGRRTGSPAEQTREPAPARFGQRAAAGRSDARTGESGVARPAPRAAFSACPAPTGRPRLTAWFDGPYGQRVLTKRVRRGTRVRIRGRLTDAQGRPIGGAALALVEYVAGRSRRASGATTRRDGRFTTFTRLGPARALRFSYRGANSPILRLMLRAARDSQAAAEGPVAR